MYDSIKLGQFIEYKISIFLETSHAECEGKAASPRPFN